MRPDRIAEAEAAAALLSTAGKRVCRRTLSTAGVHGSNADLGALARIVKSQPPSGKAPATSPSSPARRNSELRAKTSRTSPDGPGPSSTPAGRYSHTKR